ncbi:MAG: hypothetical protein IKC11_02145 [Clostridia bacterium]|nr:hypothetical protein [Clostridia bacterium]
MKKRYKIILSMLLPIMCITSLCLSFLLPNTKAQEEIPNKNVNTTAEDTGASSAGKDKKGGAVYIENGATYVMNGGTISGMTKNYGGAVYVSNGATFTMNAGTITGCTAKYGGAVYVEAGGTCNITGGTITGNKAQYAPAIYVEDGGILNVDQTATIKDNEYKEWPITIEDLISSDTIAVGNPSANFNLPYIDFGIYPQTYVGSSMNTTLESWYNSNSPTAVNTYTVRTRTWQAYQYTDGNIYARGLSLQQNNTSYTYLNGETVIASGSVVWFKVEPIRWIILNYDAYTAGTDSELEIMSYLVLTADIRFNPSGTDADGTAGTSDDPNQWVNSELRTWLNSTFYTSAFTSDEQELISTTTVGNNITGNYKTSTSNTTGVATEDKVYCLSYWDYYNSAGLFTKTSTKRLCSPTDFALGNDCYKYTSTSYVTATYPSGGTCYYWTRSAGSSASYAFSVLYGGGISTSNVYYSNYGVRPALRISI